MKRVLLYCAGLTIVLISIGCKQPEAPKVAEEVAASVQIVSLVPRTLKATFTLSGVVVAREDIMLGAELGGKVEKVVVTEGDLLTKDSAIAEVNLTGLKATLDQAQAHYELAELNHDRQKKLFDKKLISPGKMDTHTADLKVAKANLEAAKINYKKGVITSPITGRLDKLDIDVGEVLMPGQVVARVITYDKVEIHVSVPEKDITDISEGDTTLVHLLNHPDTTASGVVSFIAIATDNGNKTFLTKIIVDNKKGLFRPGMIVNVTFTRKPLLDRIIVPQTSVLTKDGRKWVFVAENDRAREHEVRTGEVINHEVEIKEGLQSGEMLIVTGQYSLLDGDKIKIVETKK